MSLRDRLAERARPYLEPGEQIQAVFRAWSDVWRVWQKLIAYFSYLALMVALMLFLHPWSTVISYVFILATPILVLLFVRLHDVVVTDRAIVVLDISKLKHRPTRLRLRHPRNFYFGQLSGLTSESFVLDNMKYRVNRKFFKDVATADAALTQMTQ